MDNKNVTINIVNNGTFNYAQDKSTINSTQNYNDLKDKLKNTIFKYPSKYEDIVNEDNASKLPEKGIEFMKNQLGSKLSGAESNYTIFDTFVKEVWNTYDKDKREGCLPLFYDLPRKQIHTFIYLDNVIVPYSVCDVVLYYMDSMEKYYIESDYYYIEVTYNKRKQVNLLVGNFQEYSDVNTRLLGFVNVNIFMYKKWNIKMYNIPTLIL